MPHQIHKSIRIVSLSDLDQKSEMPPGVFISY